jgi:hypothetical protein
MHRTLGSMAAAALLAGCSVFGIRSGYEQSSYTVVEEIEGNVEIRRYAPRLAAETAIDATEDGDARNRAFRRLFAYISGANRADEEVAMTTPVETRASETIAMTVPVESSGADGEEGVIRFFVPVSYTDETVPTPTDPEVRIVHLPATTVAVLRFSGSWSEDALDERRADLLDRLDRSAWIATGTPTTMFYDPPWTLPFLRRNEVAVPVELRP